MVAAVAAGLTSIATVGMQCHHLDGVKAMLLRGVTLVVTRGPSSSSRQVLVLIGFCTAHPSSFFLLLTRILDNALVLFGVGLPDGGHDHDGLSGGEDKGRVNWRFCTKAI